MIRISQNSRPAAQKLTGLLPIVSARRFIRQKRGGPRSNVVKNEEVSQYDDLPKLKTAQKPRSTERLNVVKKPESSLKYSYENQDSVFAQLVSESDQLNQNTQEGAKVISLESILESDKAYFNEKIVENDGNEPDDLLSSREKRYHPDTLYGKCKQNSVEVPETISSSISKLVKKTQMQTLRDHAARYFVDLRTQAHRATYSEIDTDTHLTAVFLQNYASSYAVINEAKQRMGKSWRPDKILDVGFGPATGMIALNEIFAHDEEWNPSKKHAVVIGHDTMRTKARTILSTQKKEQKGNADSTKKKEKKDDDHVDSNADQSFQSYTRTSFKNRIPLYGAEVRYDLIIATHQLYKNTQKFPISIDYNASRLVSLLSPNGVLILVERGDPNGFESIARARQIMIRPEDSTNLEKIPNLWRDKESSSRKIDASYKVAKDEDLNFEEDFLKELAQKGYEIEHDSLAEDQAVQKDSLSSELVSEKPTEPETTGGIYLKVLAPCSHHGKCPLQTSDPLVLNKSRKATWCMFSQMVQRPKFSMELKKGLQLASDWETPYMGMGISGQVDGGSGRSGGRNFEFSNYSYLIVQRSESPMVSNSSSVEERAQSWSRVLLNPMKRDKHVIMQVCAPSGDIEKWIIPKSFDKQTYHDARKANQGDLWALDAKTKLKMDLNSNLKDDRKVDKLKKALRKEKKAAEKLDLKGKINSKVEESDKSTLRSIQHKNFERKVRDGAYVADRRPLPFENEDDTLILEEFMNSKQTKSRTKQKMSGKKGESWF
ncbi:mitochondrial ribosomal protein [Nadsonia fulvescens var. elongata DSM 6958]|uniref:Mitochondrial ribosomal protein n=1 Tax=Nadsonia fulvescens var. elongata DSM 6958 TaxID=857566 RepID=A0A1E3PHH4_9ASCO|nr:mitochondrial ribosomal protein [Nadsonia fulvescens var. elongata DSM 6958]